MTFLQLLHHPAGIVPGETRRRIGQRNIDASLQRPIRLVFQRTPVCGHICKRRRRFQKFAVGLKVLRLQQKGKEFLGSFGCFDSEVIAYLESSADSTTGFVPLWIKGYGLNPISFCRSGLILNRSPSANMPWLMITTGLVANTSF